MPTDTQEHASPVLSSCLHEIEKGGHVLRQALLQHDADAIWNAIAQQEECLARLQSCCSRQETAPEDSARPAEHDLVTRELIARTRSVLRTNRVLARTFLDIVDKTLARLALGGAVGPSVYNQSGKMGSLSSPLLVQQRG